MQAASSMPRSTTIVSSSTGRAVPQLRRGQTARHGPSTITCRSTAVAVRDLPGVASHQLDDSASSSTASGTAASYSMNIQPPQDMPAAAQPDACMQSYTDDERLLTLQLLNEHTQSIAAHGYMVHSAAVAPAGVNAVLWKQRIVELYANCRKLDVTQAQEQVDGILAHPQKTPCFVAFGPSNTAATNDKTVVGLVVGSITQQPAIDGHINTSVKQQQPGSSSRSVQEKHLQIDTLRIEGLAGLPMQDVASSDGLCAAAAGSPSDCGDPNCWSCRRQGMGRTLLLWLMGEAGCFDHTDAKVSLSAWNCNHLVLCLFSQLGFEPWHEPRGRPGALSDSSSSRNGSKCIGGNSSSKGSSNTMHEAAAISGLGLHPMSHLDSAQGPSLAATAAPVSTQMGVQQQQQQQQQQPIQGSGDVGSAGAVELHRPAGLLPWLREPQASQQAVPGQMSTAGDAAGKLSAGSNIVAFRRK